VLFVHRGVLGGVSTATFGVMTKRREKITISRKLSSEGEAMNKAFKKATKRATSEAFTVWNTLL
jgi:hypothetical protein